MTLPVVQPVQIETSVQRLPLTTEPPAIVIAEPSELEWPLRRGRGWDSRRRRRRSPFDRPSLGLRFARQRLYVVEGISP